MVGVVGGGEALEWGLWDGGGEKNKAKRAGREVIWERKQRWGKGGRY